LSFENFTWSNGLEEELFGPAPDVSMDAQDSPESSPALSDSSTNPTEPEDEGVSAPVVVLIPPQEDEEDAIVLFDPYPVEDEEEVVTPVLRPPAVKFTVWRDTLVSAEEGM
jgi:hypothetical protein